MKIIHLRGFTNEERMTYKTIIYNNVLLSMKALVLAAQDKGISLGSNVVEAAERVKSTDAQFFSGTLTAENASDIKLLWGDEGIRKMYQRQAEFQLNDSAAYYFDAVDRLADKNYIPTEQDVLRSRAKTTGIIETEFVIEKTKFRMVDVGGQRSERKKWMHCFQDVTAVIFCVALSEYDLKLYEDDSTNRMHESLKLFREICNSKWFTDTAMILFLNKRDLFADKIKKVDLKVAFDDYNGGLNYDNAVTFIKDKFLSQNENPKKHVYTHVTCATDTDSIQVVFNAVKDIILQGIINDTGIGV
jgi:GTPase SAR1 family protein